MRKQLFIAPVIVLAISTTLFVILVFILNSAPSISSSAQAAAVDVITPTITALEPSSAFNDLNTAIVITGTDFTAELSGTLVLTSPTAYLGSTALMDVTWVNSTSITATVPWGLDPGGYSLTVINPDGGSGSLVNAFTVTQGIGQWNGGNMFGGTVNQILLKPGDPYTLYALGDVGLFRSRDAAETWHFILGGMFGQDLVEDPHHSSRLYSVRYYGLCLSEDEGDTWTVILNQWPDGKQLGDGQVYISPDNEQLMFFSSAIQRDGTYGALGLIKSTDGGASWVIVSDMEGISVRTLAFRPDNPQEMVLGTSDGRVFQSIDGGEHWNPVIKQPHIDDIGIITYNPFISGEVWVSASWLTWSAGIVKSVDSMLTDWVDISPTNQTYVHSIDFASASSVYLSIHWAGGYHSDDDGVSWLPFGPSTGGYDIAFSPYNPNVMYMGGFQYGVQKTSDGGQTWEVKNQGFSDLVVIWIEAPKDDLRHVYAVIDGWQGVFRSIDSAASWEFIPVQDVWNIRRIKVDPFDSQHIYLTADTGFYTSADGGTSWVPADVSHHFQVLQPDPFQQGRLLASGVSMLVPGSSALYVSTDSGQTWEEVPVAPDFAGVDDIAFDPLHPGVVFLTTAGSGVYRSQDNGITWVRIASENEAMNYSVSIAIATYPQPMIIVDGGHAFFRSLDGGDTWVEAGCLGGNFIGGSLEMHLFVDGDSRRFYSAMLDGLYMSVDGVDTCLRANGVLGRLRTTALSYSGSGDQTILYAATTGGNLGGTLSKVVDTSQESLTTEGNLVESGIYRYVQHIRQTFLPLAQR